MDNQIKLSLNDFTIEELNAILAALQELPGKICNPISQKIKSQAEEQIAAIQAANAPKADEAANQAE